MLCFAFGCDHKNGKNACSFFRFPIIDKKKYALWKDMSRRSDRDPGHDDRLCSCHFVNGEKSNGPSIFSYNQGSRFDFPDPPGKSRDLNKSTVEVEMELEEEESTNSNGYKESPSLLAELYFLRKENEELKQKLEKLEKSFPFSQIKENDEHVLMYTGLPNASTFYVLLNFIKRLEFDYKFGWNVENITLEDQLFITLQKLRQNYSFADLAIRYSVSDTTIRNIFYTLFSVIHESLFESIVDGGEIPTLKKIQETCTTDEEFENCRFIIDTTEIEIENPRGDLDAQRQTYSHYKKKQTFKGMAAVAPNGVICFASKLYPGSTSDKELFRDSGLLKKLNPGDLLLADKGFLIHDILPQGVTVNIPPFLYNKQFTEQEVKFTTKIARKRIHVERAFQRLKNFDILDNIPHHLRTEATKIFQVCAILVNLQNPLIKE